MKKTYQSPILRIANVAPHGRILQAASRLDGNGDLVVGPPDDDDDDNRVKSSYSIWDDDWSK